MLARLAEELTLGSESESRKESQKVLPKESPTGYRLASAWPNRLEWGLVIQKESDSAPQSVSPTGLAR